MPRVGYTSITVTKEVYNIILRLMERENEEAGYRKFRSVSHFVEEKIMADVQKVQAERKREKR